MIQSHLQESCQTAKLGLPPFKNPIYSSRKPFQGRKNPFPDGPAGPWTASVQPTRCTLANIRQIEYSEFVRHMLREYKASVFHALAHPTRIAILEALRD